jgi:hypothetical protein
MVSVFQPKLWNAELQEGPRLWPRRDRILGPSVARCSRAVRQGVETPVRQLLRNSRMSGLTTSAWMVKAPWG